MSDSPEQDLENLIATEEETQVLDDPLSEEENDAWNIEGEDEGEGSPSPGITQLKPMNYEEYEGEGEEIVGEAGAVRSRVVSENLPIYSEFEGETKFDEETSSGATSSNEEEVELKALTSEELLLKEEEERRLAISEAKKETIRKPLRLLRQRYRILQRRNLKLPEVARLSKDDLVIDDRPYLARQQQYEEKLQEYYKTQEFEAAKQFVQMQKIREFFFNRVETHYFVVTDLEHKNQVATFRVQLPSSSFWKLVELNRTWIEEEQLMQKMEEEVVEEEKEQPEPVKRFHAKDLIGNYYLSNYDISTQHAIKNLEKRLEKRYEKECEVAVLNAEKLPQNWESPSDLAAIKYAEEHMGDYKLKEAEDFVGEQLSTAQRRQKIVDLKLEMYQRMHQFNKIVVLLRDEKPGLIIECRKLIDELVKLQKYLPVKLRTPLPIIYDLEPSEYPEKSFDITREDLDARIAKKVDEFGFQQQKEVLEKKFYESSDENVGPEERVEIPAIYFRTAKHPDDMDINEPSRPSQTEMQKLACRSFIPKIQPLPKFAQAFDGLPNSVYRYRQLVYESRNEADTSKRDKVIAQRQYKQDELYKELIKKIEYFKNRTLSIIAEKVHLDVNLKLMQLTLMNLFEELDISKEFEDEERDVHEKLRLTREEYLSSKDMTDRSRRKVENANRDLEKVNSELTRNLDEVALVIGEKNRFADYLWKLFRKQLNVDIGHEYEHTELAIKPAGTSSRNSVKSTASSQSLRSNKDFFMVQIPKDSFEECPKGLDATKFEKVIELRTKHRRLKLERETHRQIVAQQNKNFDEAENQFRRQETKVFEVTNEVNTVRRRKQERINNIDKAVIVKAHQIECMDEEKMDEIDSDFEQKMLNAFLNPVEVLAIQRGMTTILNERAEEIKLETKLNEGKLKRARKLRQRVHEELLKKEKIVVQLQENCKTDMTRKFGRVLDLDEVCAAVINLEILEALAKLESRRNEQFYEQHLVSKDIDSAKSQLMGVTKINSELNTLVAILEERQRDIEYYQHIKGKEVQQVQTEVRDQPSYEVSESREIMGRNDDLFDDLDRLDDLIWQQEMKIGVLRSVISMCRTKGPIPPIVRLSTVQRERDISRNYLTYQELMQFKESNNRDVITIFKKDGITETLDKSMSDVPFDQHQHHHHHTHSTEQEEYEEMPLTTEEDVDRNDNTEFEQALEESYPEEEGEYEEQEDTGDITQKIYYEGEGPEEE